MSAQPLPSGGSPPPEHAASGKNPRPLSVFLLHDYPLVSQGVSQMLAAHADRVRINPTDPDVILCDPLSGPPEATQAMWEVLQEQRHTVIVFSWSMPIALLHDVLEQGCAGYIDKSVTAAQLVQGIEEAAAGKTCLYPAPGTHIRPGGDGVPGCGLAALESLTTREAQLMELITLGMTNEAISEHFSLSINTVKSYIRSAYQKLDITRRPEAVRWGMEHGLHHSAQLSVRRSPSGDLEVHATES